MDQKTPPGCVTESNHVRLAPRLPPPRARINTASLKGMAAPRLGVAACCRHLSPFPQGHFAPPALRRRECACRRGVKMAAATRHSQSPPSSSGASAPWECSSAFIDNSPGPAAAIRCVRPFDHGQGDSTAECQQWTGSVALEGARSQVTSPTSPHPQQGCPLRKSSATVFSMANRKTRAPLHAHCPPNHLQSCPGGHRIRLFADLARTM